MQGTSTSSGDCVKHFLANKYVCKDCDVLICETCWISQHPTHTVLLVAVERMRKLQALYNKKEISDALPVAQKKRYSLKSVKQKLEQALAQVDLLLEPAESQFKNLQKLSCNAAVLEKAVNDVTQIDSPVCQSLLSYLEDREKTDPSKDTDGILVKTLSELQSTINTYLDSHKLGFKPKKALKIKSTKSSNAETECSSQLFVPPTWTSFDVKEIGKGNIEHSKSVDSISGTWWLSLYKSQGTLADKRCLMTNVIVNFRPTDAFGDRNLKATIGLKNHKKRSLEEVHTKSIVWDSRDGSACLESLIPWTHLLNSDLGWSCNGEVDVWCKIEAA